MTSAAKASEQVVEAAGAASVPVDGAGAELFEGEIGGSTGMEDERLQIRGTIRLSQVACQPAEETAVGHQGLRDQPRVSLARESFAEGSQAGNEDGVAVINVGGECQELGPVDWGDNSWCNSARQPGPARCNLLWVIGCILCVFPLTINGGYLVVESESSYGYLGGVALLLIGSLLSFNVCCTLLVAGFSSALAREAHFVPVVCCLCCVPAAWLVGFCTFGVICLASPEQCVVPQAPEVTGAILLSVGLLPHIIMMLCMPRCTPFSSRPPRAVYNEWLLIASTPIGTAVMQDDKEQVLGLARSMPLAERQRVFRLRMAALRYEALDNATGITMEVHRESVYKDVVETVMQEGTALQAGLAQVSFDGEEGIDAGGLTRAIFAEFSHELLGPKCQLFREVTAEGNYTVQPEPCAFDLKHFAGDEAFPPGMASTERVEWHYQACGRILGLALLMGNLMDATFALFFLKQVLGHEELDMRDLEVEDAALAMHLQWMQDNSVQDVVMSNFVRVPSSASIVLGVTEEEAAGVASTELLENGAEIAVTDENKGMYVEKVVEHKLVTSIKPQVAAFRKGVLDVVPEAVLGLLDPLELQQEISGGGLDRTGGDERARVVKDWREHTQYLGAYSKNAQANHPVVSWFWELIDTDDPEIRRDIPLDALLRFTTGSSRVPAGGFANLQQNGRPRPFTIDSAADTVNDLPCASTCANLLHIPQYRSKAILRKKLTWALAGGNANFGRA